MRRTRYVCRFLAAIAVMATPLLALPAPVMADGGPILSDPQLWAQLEEGQQIAVITLGSSNTARVDLFISMLDRSGESHEIVFFLPLGMDPTDFSVVEETSLDFDQAQTEELDHILTTEAYRVVGYKRIVRLSLLLGTLFINGAWSWPLWLLLPLSGCAVGTPYAPVEGPIATYETESSRVDIYGVDEDTDLQGLIRTTGLDPAVQETLSRFQGQQIAIVTLQTQPSPEETGGYWEPTGQPGIHLAWTTTLVSHSAVATYSYPLGTGSAWASPIEITRVYVVAPPGTDFATQYPRLGADLSGFEGDAFFHRPLPRIMDAKGPGYAVENAVGDFGRVWRITYLKSNAAEDVVVTRLSKMSAGTRTVLRGQRFERPVTLLTWLISQVVALALWLIAWRYTMPRLLGMEYRWLDLRLWGHALGWALLYPATNSVALVVAVSLSLLTLGVGALLGIPLLIVTLLGVVSILLFAVERSRALGVSRGRAAMAYVVVVLIANAIYLPFALGYAALVGAL
jgi:hypothetical protein